MNPSPTEHNLPWICHSSTLPLRGELTGLGVGVYVSLCPFLLFSPLLGARFLDRRTIRTQGTWWVAEAVGETWESPGGGGGMGFPEDLRGAMAWQEGSQQGLQCRVLLPGSGLSQPSQALGLQALPPEVPSPLWAHGQRMGLPQPKQELEEGQLIGLPATSPMGLPFTLSVLGVRDEVDGTGKGTPAWGTHFSTGFWQNLGPRVTVRVLP